MSFIPTLTPLGLPYSFKQGCFFLVPKPLVPSLGFVPCYCLSTPASLCSCSVKPCYNPPPPRRLLWDFSSCLSPCPRNSCRHCHMISHLIHISPGLVPLGFCAVSSISLSENSRKWEKGLTSLISLKPHTTVLGGMWLGGIKIR